MHLFLTLFQISLLVGVVKSAVHSLTPNIGPVDARTIVNVLVSPQEGSNAISELPTDPSLTISQHNSAVHVLLALQTVGCAAFDKATHLKQPISDRVDDIKNLNRSHGLVDGRLVKTRSGKNNNLFVALPE